jgi:hypothetical protein
MMKLIVTKRYFPRIGGVEDENEFIEDLIQKKIISLKQALLLKDNKDITLDDGTRVQLQGD